MSYYDIFIATVASPRRLLLLCGLAAVVGAAGGAAAYVLVHLIALLTNLAFFHRVAWTLPSFTHLHRSPGIVLVAVTGGLIVGMIAKWAPIIRGHGIPEAMEAVLTRQSRIAPRTAIAKPVSAAIAIGSGGPFGAEGPIIPGVMSFALLSRLVTDWMGADGHLDNLDVSFRRPIAHGDALRLVALVTDTDTAAASVKLDVYIENARGERPLQGTAVVALPRRA